MKRSHAITYTILALLLVLSGAAALIISCGGSTTSSQMTTATVNTSISDPPTCSNSAPNGQFTSVYVTITKATAHLNADAGPNDSGWQTLVDLTSAPKQIDLLSLANTTCVLTQLGSTTLLLPGKYQQIRLYLLSNSPASGTPTPSSNSCGNSAGWNCVVPTSGSPEELLLSSESHTGIKIPASQITSGGLTVSAGQAVDLDINFDTCASLVHQGNHKWRLKPVLHAGEVTTENNALSGTVIDTNTQKGIPGATVSLEQPDSSGDVDVISSGTITDANGNFSFCPLTKGATYDVVVTAQTSGPSGVTYNATVTLGVPVGSAMGNIQMVPETTASSSSPATILGQVTSTSVSSSPAPGDQTAAIITISTFQDAGGGKIVTIPPFTGTASFTTGTSPNVSNGTSPTTCPAGTDCENYILTVPASNPSVGMFTQGQPTTYSTPAANSALYWVQALATVPTGNNAGQADCTPSVIPTPLAAGVSPMGNQIQAVPSPVTQDFNFVACTAGQ
jgi:Domain of unknown function (DUF4382)/Carboxypeptidase regulatory-like domain